MIVLLGNRGRIYCTRCLIWTTAKALPKKKPAEVTPQLPPF